MMNNQLNDQKQKLLALAKALGLAHKFSIQKQFEDYAKEWIASNEAKRAEDGFNIDYILHGLPRAGDSGTIGEELLADVPDVETKCTAIVIAVKEGIFTLEEALKAYQVTLEQYGDYIKYNNT